MAISGGSGNFKWWGPVGGSRSLGMCPAGWLCPGTLPLSPLPSCYDISSFLLSCLPAMTLFLTTDPELLRPSHWLWYFIPYCPHEGVSTVISSHTEEDDVAIQVQFSVCMSTVLGSHLSSFRWWLSLTLPTPHTAFWYWAAPFLLGGHWVCVKYIRCVYVCFVVLCF